jgi:hypothetical protein
LVSVVKEGNSSVLMKKEEGKGRQNKYVKE